MIDRMWTPETYPALLADTLEYGAEEIQRNEITRAGQPMIFHFDAGEMVTRRGFNPSLAFIEALCLVGGRTDRVAIRLAAPKTFQSGYFDGRNVEYGEMYSRKVRDALRNGFHLSRRCVLFGGSNNMMMSDMPCATSIHLQVIHGQFLSVTVFQRSWDLVKGLPYNITMWGFAAKLWARAAGLLDATVYIMASNPHIYLEDGNSPMLYDIARARIEPDYLDGFGKTDEEQTSRALEVLEKWKDIKSRGMTYPLDGIIQTPF